MCFECRRILVAHLQAVGGVQICRKRQIKLPDATLFAFHVRNAERFVQLHNSMFEGVRHKTLVRAHSAITQANSKIFQQDPVVMSRLRTHWKASTVFLLERYEQVPVCLSAYKQVSREDQDIVHAWVCRSTRRDLKVIAMTALTLFGFLQKVCHKGEVCDTIGDTVYVPSDARGKQASGARIHLP